MANKERTVETFLIRGIQAAIARDPVSGSVWGKSSQINASVSFNVLTRVALRNLQQNAIIRHINRYFQ
jgi:hypothetical protein